MSADAEAVAAALIDSLAPGSGVGLAVHDEHLRGCSSSPPRSPSSPACRRRSRLGHTLLENLPAEIGEAAEATAAPGRGDRRAAARRRVGHPDRARARLADQRLPARARGAQAARHRRARRHGEPPRAGAARAEPAAARRGAAPGPVGSWSWEIDEDRWTWSEELFALAGLERAGDAAEPARAAGRDRARAPRRGAGRDLEGAARRRALRDRVPAAAGRRPPARHPRPRRAGPRAVGARRADRRLRPGRHRARARRGAPARRRGARQACAVRHAGRGARRPGRRHRGA